MSGLLSWDAPQVSKYARVVKEGERIWERQASWNVDGVQGGPIEDGKYETQYMYGKRRSRYRPLIKYRRKQEVQEIEVRE